MERERTRHSERPRQADPGSGGDDHLRSVRDQMREMLEHADQIMDSLGHLDAESYLQQNRQTGGQ